MQRQLSFLAELTSDIRHVPGKANVVADALSRPPPSALASVKEPPGSLATTRQGGKPNSSTSSVASGAGKGRLPASLDGGQCKRTRWVSDYCLAERQAKSFSIYTRRAAGGDGVRHARDRRRAGFFTCIGRAGPSPSGRRGVCRDSGVGSLHFTADQIFSFGR